MKNQRSGRLPSIIWVVLVFAGIVVAVTRMSRQENEAMNLKANENTMQAQPAGVPTQLKTAASPSPETSLSPVKIEPADHSLANKMGLSGAIKTSGKDVKEARREFRRQAEEVYKVLPTMKSMQGLTSEEVHEMPKFVQEAGERLGSIAESLASDPRLANDGIQFYRQCYKRNDLITQVRALCLGDFRHWSKLSGSQKAGAPAPEDLTGVPRDVIDLAAQLGDSN